MVVRQVRAAIVRCACVISTRASFSASANVAGETSGPTAGVVPKVGGAPAGAVPCCWPSGALRQDATAPRRPNGAVIRNWRREFIFRGEAVELKLHRQGAEEKRADLGFAPLSPQYQPLVDSRSRMTSVQAAPPAARDTRADPMH